MCEYSNPPLFVCQFVILLLNTKFDFKSIHEYNQNQGANVAHHRTIKGELIEAGSNQLWLHSFYAKHEPWVLKILDGTLRFFLKVRLRPILWALSRLLGHLLPTGEVITTKQATDLIDTISSNGNSEIAIGPCRCQMALGKRKGTLLTDMVILYGSEAYKRVDSEYTDMSPNDAKKLLQDLNQEGRIPTIFACMGSAGWLFVICNCESEICFPYRAHQAVGAVFHPGPDIVALDSEKCTACGVCVERCHFGANTLANPIAKIDLAKCYGCGLCVSTCSGKARKMVKRENYHNKYYPLELVAKATAH